MYLVKLDASNTVVERLSLAEEALLPLAVPLTEYVIVTTPAVPGQVFDPITGQFTSPPRRRWLTKLAFDNRFTMAEAVNLKVAQNFPARIAGETDAEYNARCALPAQLQVLQGRLNMASYIDLDRADTVAGVQALESLGLLAAGRAAEILSGTIADHEYHAGA